MKIIFKKNFVKNYLRLPKNLQEQVDEVILRFEKDPQDKKLKNHALAGIYAGLRAISAGYDLRIIFEEKENYMEVLLLKVGSHSSVY
ncbi:MAG: type II toxin-antitoxin system mRNA interferase toxin, RelE/StbE family [Candidatus Peregrinibacteria bacterium]